MSMYRSCNKWYCSVLVALLATNTGIAQQPFQVDASFGTSLQLSIVNDVVELPDGRLLASGSMRVNSQPGEERSVRRFLANGSLDPSFAMAVSGATQEFISWNNKWYNIAGYTIVRLEEYGEADNTFQFPQGFPTVQNGGVGDFHAFLDGSLLICGSFLINDPDNGFMGEYSIAWINNDGTLNTTKVHKRSNGFLSRLVALPNGKFLCGGGFGLTQYDGQSVGGIIRINEDGSLDTTYTGISFSYGYPWKFLPLVDGKVVVVGAMDPIDVDQQTSIVRLQSNGEIDTMFHSIVALHINGTPTTSGSITNIVPWGADRFIVTGTFTELDGIARGGIAMIDTAGNVVDDYFSGPGCDLGAFFGSNAEYVTVSGITGPLADGSYLIHGLFQGYNDGTTNYPNQRYITKLYGPDVGIAEHQKLQLNLYPNPATTEVTLQLEKIPTNAIVRMRDALGREVLQQRITGHYTTLGTAGLGAGVYVVEVWEIGQRLGVERVVLE